jgi:hypothetical protein
MKERAELSGGSFDIESVEGTEEQPFAHRGHRTEVAECPKDEKGSVSAIYLLFSGHQECFDMISNYSIGNPDFQP